MDTTSAPARTREHDGKLDLMARMPLFAGCSSRQLRFAAQLFDAALLPGGTVLHREGGQGRWLFLLAHGSALAGHDDRPTQIAEAGACWGHQAFFACRLEPWTIEALSSVTVLTIDRRSFGTLARLLPNVAGRLRRAGLRTLGPNGGGSHVAASGATSEMERVA